jgi:hypothetical protein
MKTTIEPYEEELGSWEDGDWEVKFYLDNAVLITYVIASNENDAIYHAEERVSHLLAYETPEEVVITLKGIYK